MLNYFKDPGNSSEIFINTGTSAFPCSFLYMLLIALLASVLFRTGDSATPAGVFFLSSFFCLQILQQFRPKRLALCIST